MEDKLKIALFDFCETLANFQTADAFVQFVRESSNSPRMQRKEIFRQTLYKTRIISILMRLFRKSSINKRLILWQLKGFRESELERLAESYYYTKVKPNLISPVIKELIRLQMNGWRIVIVSAGYEIYLKYFCHDYCISEKNLISVKIKFTNRICDGCFDGGDRLWDKTQKLDQIYSKEKIESIAYSDSISDLPLLTWANKGVVVRRHDKKSWSEKYNFKEIIWQL